MADAFKKEERLCARRAGEVPRFHLVVSNPLKTISQLGSLFRIYGKQKMFQTTNQPYRLGPPYLSTNWVEAVEGLTSE